MLLMKICYATIVCSLCFFSCSAFSSVAATDVVQNFPQQSIRLIHGIGKSVNISGHFFVSSYLREVDITDWKLEKKIEDVIIKKVPNFLNVLSAEYAVELKTDKYLASSERGLRFDLGDENILPTVRNYSANHQSDYILIVVPYSTSLNALWVANAGRHRAYDSVRVSISIALFDVKRGKIVHDQARLGWCEAVKFNFKNSDSKEELELNRENVQKLWLNCLGSEIDHFFSRYKFVR